MSLTSSASIMLMRHTGTEQTRQPAALGWLAALARRPPCVMTVGRAHGIIASIHGLAISKVAISCRPHGLSNSLICSGQSGSLIETRTRERD